MSSRISTVLLKDFVNPKRGISYGIVQPGPDVPEGTPIIRVCDMGSNDINLNSLKKVSPSIAKKYCRTELQGGELLISVVGTPGICMIAGEGLRGCNLARAVAMVPIEDALIRSWCRYYILSAEGQAYIERSLNTTVQKTLNLKDLGLMPVPVFDRVTMSSFVNLLDTIEAKISNNWSTNDYLAELCEALATREAAPAGTLADICSQVATKVSYEVADISTYVSTESLIADKGGRQTASSLPATGKVTAYVAGDTLVSNIRPYFKKIWYADCDGTCSGDVIVFRATDPLLAPYVYACLRQDAFFDFVMAGSKGTKMPRGDKKQMMTFPINPYCDDEDLATITSAARQIGANNRENTNLAELRDALLPKLMSGEIDVSQVVITLPNNHLIV